RFETASINRAVAALRAQNISKQGVEQARELLARYSAPVGLAASLNGERSNRLAAAEWLSRCHRLSQALVRNRKAEVGGFTARVAHRIEVDPTQAELDLQD